MLEESNAIGSISTSTKLRRQYAASSMSYNKSVPQFRKLFPQFTTNDEQSTVDSKVKRTPESQIVAGNSHWNVLLSIVLVMIVVFIIARSTMNI